MIHLESITNEQLESLRDAFGQCSVVYETMELGELREDLFSTFVNDDTGGEWDEVVREAITRRDVLYWLDIRLAIESVHTERAYASLDRTDEQIEEHSREDAEFFDAIRTRVNEWIDENLPEGEPTDATRQ